jgi:hypothetical protein
MFPVKYGLNFHIAFRSNLVFKGLNVAAVEAECIGKWFIRYNTQWLSKYSNDSKNSTNKSH